MAVEIRDQSGVERWAFPLATNHDVELKLVRMLPAQHVARFGRTSRAGYRLTRSEALWEVLCARAFAALVRRGSAANDQSAKRLVEHARGEKSEKSPAQGKRGACGSEGVGKWRTAWWGTVWARTAVYTWGSSHRGQTGHEASVALPTPLHQLHLRAGAHALEALTQRHHVTNSSTRKVLTLCSYELTLKWRAVWNVRHVSKHVFANNVLHIFAYMTSQISVLANM